MMSWMHYAVILIILQSIGVQGIDLQDVLRSKRSATYAPRLECQQDIYYAAIGDYITMVVLVDANPSNTGMSVTSPGGTIISKHENNVTISIESVERDQFRTYVVTMSNTVGSTSVSCILANVETWDGYDTMPRPAWDVSDTLVNRGSDLELTCTVDNTQPGDVIRIIKFTDIGDGIENTIADNDQVMAPFNDTGRYDVSRTYADGVTTLTLTYTDIQGEDSGVLLCHVVNNAVYVAKARTNLEVEVPLDDLYITFNGSRLAEGDIITYVEGEEPEYIRCIASVKGGLDAPEVWMSIGELNLTSHLTVSDSSSILGPLGPLEVTKTLIYSPLMSPSYELNGQTLYCHSGEEVASALVDIKFYPRVTCPDPWNIRPTLNLRYEIICSVLSNPADPLVELIVENGNRTGIDFRYEAVEDDLTNAILLIESYQDINDGDYIVRATNIIGTGEDTLKLIGNHAAATRWSELCLMTFASVIVYLKLSN